MQGTLTQKGVEERSLEAVEDRYFIVGSFNRPQLIAFEVKVCQSEVGATPLNPWSSSSVVRPSRLRPCREFESTFDAR